MGVLNINIFIAAGSLVILLKVVSGTIRTLLKVSSVHFDLHFCTFILIIKFWAQLRMCRIRCVH